jgi:hypothetical protein
MYGRRIYCHVNGPHQFIKIYIFQRFNSVSDNKIRLNLIQAAMRNNGKNVLFKQIESSSGYA